jgi:hypothetical protein
MAQELRNDVPVQSSKEFASEKLFHLTIYSVCQKIWAKLSIMHDTNKLGSFDFVQYEANFVIYQPCIVGTKMQRLGNH